MAQACYNHYWAVSYDMLLIDLRNVVDAAPEVIVDMHAPHRPSLMPRAQFYYTVLAKDPREAVGRSGIIKGQRGGGVRGGGGKTEDRVRFGIGPG